MNEGRYVYCILESRIQGRQNFGDIGIGERPVFTVGYKDLNAVVSAIPFKEMDSKVEDIVAHQRVVEEARKAGTVLPVRFGVILKAQEGVEKLLASSYTDFRSKIVKLKDKNEFGVKVLIGQDGRKKIQKEVYEESEEVKKIKQELSSSTGQGSSYFIKMRLDDAVKNETLRKIDRIAGEIHETLTKTSEESKLLKADVQQIVLNASYLIDKSNGDSFTIKLGELTEKYESKGFKFHMSGPWAPYSFC